MDSEKSDKMAKELLDGALQDVHTDMTKQLTDAAFNSYDKLKSRLAQILASGSVQVPTNVLRLLYRGGFIASREVDLKSERSWGSRNDQTVKEIVEKMLTGIEHQPKLSREHRYTVTVIIDRIIEPRGKKGNIQCDSCGKVYDPSDKDECPNCAKTNQTQNDWPGGNYGMG